jgi:UDP-N-acetylmuramyl-tripeptide synthetase
VDGLRFAAAGFTNLTRDHLDLHGTMEAYRGAKARLFSDHLHPGGGTAVVNVDAPDGLHMAAAARGRVLRCSASGAPADVRVRRSTSSTAGLQAEIETPAGALRVRSALVGEYNLANVTLATGLACALSVPGDAIARGVAALAGVPGRLQPVATGTGFSIFVDYAHSPDALERVMAVLRPLARGRLIVLFGCGGDRDRTKRPLMGEAVGRMADVAVVTSDNPRTEDPLAILREIEAGMGGSSAARVTVPDRREAIRHAVGRAADGDVVLIAGKGHEDYQILGRTKVHFDDREEVAAALRGRAVP